MRPRARNYIAELEHWHCVDRGSVLRRGDDKMFGAAALVHAVDAVRGHSFAICYMEALKKLQPSVGSLSKIA